ncbi:venom carboxylesterase-6-like [Penaeus japonicus]|uniref:venom carboxylesterase-6-like n=1 Tax=Penaeus japonicus TaxID=27405 RepID=UPI001C70D01D|nr:venom carboxylesterase-6-like [Penaeus japonicus]XP_042872427.1 venom carboxylesterase-6-like [Penaeus japonicus]
MMHSGLKLLVAVLLAAFTSAEEAGLPQPSVEVRLQQGVIEGVRSEAGGGRFFYSFKSIPFAQPPVGDLRFKDPVPAEGWTGIRNGSVAIPKCMQLSISTYISGNSIIVEGQEDCLYLNVYTPKPHSSGLPVMVWIHGGAFTLGSAEEYQPLPLLTREIVLVVIQYRLATLGFLSTEDAVLPGNLGLKDQTLALRWVQDNIQNFGGDPDKVTIFGESAGGASVHYHVLSPMSKNLFKRAIMQSGTTLCPWALREDHKQVLNKLVHLFNCSGIDHTSNSLDSATAIACLMKVPADQLTSAQLAFNIWNGNPTVMLPRVDGEFLPDHPAVLLREGKYNKVDLISGITKHEGGISTRMLFLDPSSISSLVENFSQNGPAALYFDDWEEDPEYLARRTFHYYMGPMQVTVEKADAFTQLMSDIMFTKCHVDAVEHHAKDAPFGNHIYTYELAHHGEHSLLDLFFGPSPDFAKDWVNHGDDLQYLFTSMLGNATMNASEDLFVRRIMLDLWVNFAYTGNPTPDNSLGFIWTPMSHAKDSHLAITSTPFMRNFAYNQVYDFWRDMPMKVNKLLYSKRPSMC